MGLLKDKVIFLTGGSSGIGLECARKYREQEARLVIVANDAASLQQARITLELEEEDLILADVSDNAQVQAAVGAAIERYGRIDVVHNNAGIAQPVLPLHQTTDADWQRVFDVNVKSILLTTRHAFPALQRSRGCILNTSSLVGQIGQQDHAAYAGTKGAVNALTKSMALDYAPFGIRVNAVAPAGVWTDMLREWTASLDKAEEMTAYLDGIHALGYCPEGDVVADACVFLVSGKARFITGCILPVSGGAELGYRRIPG